MRSLFVDKTSSTPLWVQIKDQLKQSFAIGQLRPGDVLPSIRALARQLGVGEAMVRRAYKDLTTSGFLVTENRKCVMNCAAVVMFSECDEAKDDVRATAFFLSLQPNLWGPSSLRRPLGPQNELEGLFWLACFC